MPGAVSMDVGSQPKVMPMPEKFIKEMVADWYGAGRAQTGKWAAHNWYELKKETLILHPETRQIVEWWLTAWREVHGE